METPFALDDGLHGIIIGYRLGTERGQYICTVQKVLYVMNIEMIISNGYAWA